MKNFIFLFALSIIFIFYGHAGLSHVYADPHPNCTGYSLAGEECGGQTTKQCCPDGALVCKVADETDQDVSGTCQSCTAGSLDPCDVDAQSGDKCCGPGFVCASQTTGGGTQCLTLDQLNPPTGSVKNPCTDTSCDTAIGSIPISSTGFIQKIFQTLLSLSGGIAIIMIIFGGYKLALSQGNPEKVQQARETITSAIVGLLFIIFSITILQIIGVDVLGLTTIFSK